MRHFVHFHVPFELDNLDDLSMYSGMEEITVLTKENETKAVELGATRSAVKKWRQRGVPLRWQIRLGLVVRVQLPRGTLEAAQ